VGTCDAMRTILQRFLVGAPVAASDVDAVFEHIEVCDACHEAFDLALTAACEEMEDDLLAIAPEAFADWPAGVEPAVARHVEQCERCQAVVADLTAARSRRQERTVTRERVDVDDLFERALTVALADPEPAVRERAAARLERLRRQPALAATGPPPSAKKSRAAKEELLAGLVSAFDDFEIEDEGDDEDGTEPPPLV
jgi:hypothetical protein